MKTDELASITLPRIAVLQQLLVSLTGVLLSQTEKPAGELAALVAELHSRFGGHGGTPGDESFVQGARATIDEIAGLLASRLGLEQ